MALASAWLQGKRLQRVMPFLQAPILDVGCGDGVACTFAPDGYVGIDRDRVPLMASDRDAFRAMVALGRCAALRCCVIPDSAGDGRHGARVRTRRHAWRSSFAYCGPADGL